MRTRFYFKYLGRVMSGERAHTLMTIMAIAVGVTVLGVDLTLSKGVQESLTRNVKEMVGGDLVARGEKEPFTEEHLKHLETMKQKGAIKDFAAEATLSDMAGNGSIKTLANLWFIEPRYYPLYGPRPKTSRPPGKDVGKLLAAGVVVSELVADKLDVGVGDQIALGMDPQKYRVAGIVSDYIQPSIDMRVTGFVIRPLGQLKAALKYTPENPAKAADTIYIKTVTPGQAGKIKKALDKVFPRYAGIESAASRAKAFKQAMEALRQGDTAFGFLSLLIAGVGIGYSVRLWARRRLRDIAVLKSLGLKARQVKILFLLALGTMTVVGALLGLMFSVGAVLLLKEFAARFIGIPTQIYWFYPRELAQVAGAAFLVVTAFSLSSIGSLSRALPAIALRIQEGDLPPAGFRRQATIWLLFILLLVGAATLVIGDAVVAASVTVGALALGGAALLVFRAVVKLLPAGIPLGVNYKLVVRSLKSQGWAPARTALVILVGIAALSLVLILSESLKAQVAEEITRLSGHDAVVIVPPGASRDSERVIRRAPGGVRNMIKSHIAPIDLVSIDHSRRKLSKRLDGLISKDPYAFDLIQKINLVDLSTYKNWRSLEAGRALRAVDRRRRVVVVSGRLAKSLKLKIGQSLEIKTDSGAFSLKIIGLTEHSQMAIGDDLVAPSGSVPVRKKATSFYVNFKNADKQAPIRWLNRELGAAAVLDTAQLSAAFANVIDGIKVFPMLISLLTLIAAGVLIFNGVSMSVLQRRRELAVLKSLGAKSSKILRLLAVEHLMIGLAGGLLAVALIVPLAYLAGAAMFNRSANVNFLVVAAVVLLAVLVSVVASLAPAAGAAGSRPLEVLRDE